MVKVVASKRGRIQGLRVQNAVSQGQWLRVAHDQYSAAGDLLAAADADGYSNHYRYDDRHRMVENGYKTGLVFYFRYDARWRRVESCGVYPGRADDSLAAGLPSKLADGVAPTWGVHHVLIEYHPDGLRIVYDSTRLETYRCNEHGLLDMADTGGALNSASFRDDGWLLKQTGALVMC